MERNDTTSAPPQDGRFKASTGGYVPPSRRGGADFKSRADGPPPPSVRDSRAVAGPSESEPTAGAAPAPAGRWERGSTSASPPAAKPKPAQQAGPRACVFFARNKMCGKGDECRFSHDPQVIQEFIAAGGSEAFNVRKAHEESLALQEKEAEKWAKKDAERIKRAGPQGPKMKMKIELADDGCEQLVKTKTPRSEELQGSSWSYVPKKEGAAATKTLAGPVRTRAKPKEPALDAEDSGTSWMDTESTIKMNWASDESDEDSVEEAEEEAVYESSSSEEEIESEEEPEPAPAPKAKAKAVSAPQPKLSKAEKKALEMAELEAALADVAQVTGEQLPTQGVVQVEAKAQAESDAARKKQLKKEKQKAAAAAAAAAATEAAKAPVAVEQGQELSAEEKAGLAEKKRLKLLEDRKKQMEAKKATDKKKGEASKKKSLSAKVADKKKSKKKSSGLKVAAGGASSPAASPVATPTKASAPIAA